MALKFLNKKGWHTGSLRNIENVWKAEQKQELEQKKLEELRKQIQEEKERSEFRRLQEEAGLVPRQERLEFLYDSGLSVGKPSSDGSGGGFKSLEALPQATSNEAGASSSSVPGALFEEKQQQSANDTWRKLHSDPLLMIRQREQEALARIKNNPVKMAMIRKSVESKKHEDSANKKAKRKHSSSKNRSDSEDEDRKHKKKHSSSKHRTDSEDDGRRHRKLDSSKYRSDSEDEDRRHKKHASSKYPSEEDDARGKEKESNKEANRRSSKYKEYTDSRGHRDSERGPREENRQRNRYRDTPKDEQSHVSGRRRNVGPKLSEEERAAKLREMQMDAELHEDQRWSRLKKADEDDEREAVRAAAARGKSFLDAAQERVYGAEQGGGSSSSTIEESVRRRSHFLQSRSAAEGNAFRR